MGMGIREFLIHALGGVTKDEQDAEVSRKIEETDEYLRSEKIIPLVGRLVNLLDYSNSLYGLEATEWSKKVYSKISTYCGDAYKILLDRNMKNINELEMSSLLKEAEEKRSEISKIKEELGELENKIRESRKVRNETPVKKGDLVLKFDDLENGILKVFEVSDFEEDLSKVCISLQGTSIQLCTLGKNQGITVLKDQFTMVRVCDLKFIGREELEERIMNWVNTYLGKL
jgi:hypothetical protein